MTFTPPPSEQQHIMTEAAYAPPPAFNPDDFRDDLTGCDITEEQRLELLRLLWDMMSLCCDIGWGLEASQHICGQLIKNLFAEAASDSPDVVSLPQPALSTDFAKAQTKKGVNSP